MEDILERTAMLPSGSRSSAPATAWEVLEVHIHSGLPIRRSEDAGSANLPQWPVVFECYSI